MKIVFFRILEYIGLISSYIYPKIINRILASSRDKFITGYLKRDFASFGDSVFMWRPYTLMGQKYIHIGSKNVFEPGLQLTARKMDSTTPSIVIGDNCLFRKGCHITAVNKITIGNDLLTGTNVIITDNSHGDTDIKSLNISPRIRKIYSKGSVKIGNNVWLGNNVCVLPGVSIGDGAVIGANSVVTHDIPSHCVAAGVPIRIIKCEN